ncbi:acyl-[acyl-carrier-protein] thioesterase [Abyssisolibacter fermentans]|uniref:acyl-[acyl-carrier-protein] thioesterase n=1 Tax=Abyssisolibacter fermentans TaxID=1766203 RepID=UPI000832C326|nr:acyl-ACP thioesterase domain-containing protein [Abyssisolibacter fermentans]
MKQEWEEQFKIRGYEVDYHNELKVSSIFNFMQIAAAKHADNSNYGIEKLKDSGIYWVLSRMKVRIYSYPTYETNLKVSTWAKGTDRLFALRDYVLTTDQGIKVAEASSTWLVIDSVKKRPQKLNKLPSEFIMIEGKHAIDEIPGKIKEPEKLEHSYDKHVGYTDIDMNKHVNNEKYVEWALNSFDQDFYNKKRLSKIHINFLSECQMNQNIQLNRGKYPENTDSWYVEGVNCILDKKVFQAKVEWENR